MHLYGNLFIVIVNKANWQIYSETGYIEIVDIYLDAAALVIMIGCVFNHPKSFNKA